VRESGLGDGAVGALATALAHHTALEELARGPGGWWEGGGVGGGPGGVSDELGEGGWLVGWVRVSNHYGGRHRRKPERGVGFFRRYNS